MICRKFGETAQLAFSGFDTAVVVRGQVDDLITNVGLATTAISLSRAGETITRIIDNYFDDTNAESVRLFRKLIPPVTDVGELPSDDGHFLR